MLAGAIAAFATANETGITSLGVLAALVAGMALALLFAVISLTLQANQTATGLALTIFGRGFSALVRRRLCRYPGAHIAEAAYSAAVRHTVLGPVVFSHDILVYLSLVILAVVAWAIRSTHLGLILRAVGDSHDAAHALGYAVVAYPYAAVGVRWSVGRTRRCVYVARLHTALGAGHDGGSEAAVAVALVTFSAWRPFWLLIGAWFFGALMYLSLYVRRWSAGAVGTASALPYIGTVVVLVLISRDARRIGCTGRRCWGGRSRRGR